MTVRLPKGLTFGRRGRGVHLTAGRSPVRFSTTLRHGALTIRFRRTQAKVAVTIGAPTIFASRALARSARRHAKQKVAVGLNATDSSPLHDPPDRAPAPTHVVRTALTRSQ